MFYSVDDGLIRRIDRAGRDLFLNAEMDPSSYEWIIELAEHKTDHLPVLQEVDLFEHSFNGGPLFIPEEWDSPLEVDWAFNKVGVDLTVTVRSPEEVRTGMR